jgi:protein-tyrosine phosphatase
LTGIENSVIEVDGAWNFRDVFYDTDYPNIVFRSAMLTHLGEAGKKKLLDLGIKHIIDLRSPGEQAREGFDNAPSEITVHKFDTTTYSQSLKQQAPNAADPDTMLHAMTDDPAAQEAFGDSIMYNIYKRFVAKKSNREMFGESVNIILEGEPVVFHCAAGKDRTGWLAYLLQESAGLSHKRIVEDLEYSSNFAKTLSENFVRHKNPTEAILSTVLSTKEKYLDVGIMYMIERYGSLENYLIECGVNMDKLNKFVKNVGKGD